METLELPTGERVTPDDVFLFEGYPFRFTPAPDAPYEFVLSPLYWGGGEMDVPIADRDQLTARWGEESRGTLSEAEWTEWLNDARADDRFHEAELDAIAREVGVASDGLLDRLRRSLGR